MTKQIETVKIAAGHYEITVDDAKYRVLNAGRSLWMVYNAETDEYLGVRESLAAIKAEFAKTDEEIAAERAAAERESDAFWKNEAHAFEYEIGAELGVLAGADSSISVFDGDRFVEAPLAEIRQAADPEAAFAEWKRDLVKDAHDRRADALCAEQGHEMNSNGDVCRRCGKLAAEIAGDDPSDPAPAALAVGDDVIVRKAKKDRFARVLKITPSRVRVAYETDRGFAREGWVSIDAVEKVVVEELLSGAEPVEEEPVRVGDFFTANATDKRGEIGKVVGFDVYELAGYGVDGVILQFTDGSKRIMSAGDLGDVHVDRQNCYSCAISETCPHGSFETSRTCADYTSNAPAPIDTTPDTGCKGGTAGGVHVVTDDDAAVLTGLRLNDALSIAETFGFRKIDNTIETKSGSRHGRKVWISSAAPAIRRKLGSAAHHGSVDFSLNLTAGVLSFDTVETGRVEFYLFRLDRADSPEAKRVFDELAREYAAARIETGSVAGSKIDAISYACDQLDNLISFACNRWATDSRFEPHVATLPRVARYAEIVTTAGASIDSVFTLIDSTLPAIAFDVKELARDQVARFAIMPADEHEITDVDGTRIRIGRKHNAILAPYVDVWVEDKSKPAGASDPLSYAGMVKLDPTSGAILIETSEGRLFTDSKIAVDVDHFDEAAEALASLYFARRSGKVVGRDQAREWVSNWTPARVAGTTEGSES